MQNSRPTNRIAAIRQCSFLVAALVSSPACAHPGHGVGGGWSVSHYLTEPDHLVVALVLVVIAVASYVRRAIRARRGSQAH
jgi:hydrogenase/urease accessory protein HupE